MIANVHAFCNKLKLLKRHLERRDFTHFPCLSSLGEGCRSTYQYIVSIDLVIVQFTERFADFRQHKSEFDLITNPFDMDVDATQDNIQIELLEIH